MVQTMTEVAGAGSWWGGRVKEGDLCVQHGVFGVGLLNNVTPILPLPILVAMATKFHTKWL